MSRWRRRTPLSSHVLLLEAAALLLLPYFAAAAEPPQRRLRPASAPAKSEVSVHEVRGLPSPRSGGFAAGALGRSLSSASADASPAPTGDVAEEKTTSSSTDDMTELKDLVIRLAAMVDQQASQITRGRQNMTAMSQEMSALSGELAAVYAGTSRSIDAGWLLYSTSLVMIMQLGFALVEAGNVRRKNYRHVFLKNLLDIAVGISLWFVVGYWIAFPDKWDGELLTFDKFEFFVVAEKASHFAFQAMFSSASITIVSGAMAERTRMEAYLTFCALSGSLLHGVVVRWAWGGGWLAQLDVPYHDFAGGGVVHAAGGIAAFVGAWLVGQQHC